MSTTELRALLVTAFSAILLISLLVALVLFAIIWCYLDKKPLGMQTPLDTLIQDLMAILFLASLVASINYLKWGPFVAYPKVAIISLQVQLLTGLALYLQILFTVFVRYVYVFHHSWAQLVNDETIVLISRIANAGIATVATFFEHMRIDVTRGEDFAYLTGSSKPGPQESVTGSLKLLIVSSIVCSICMQVRIEVAKQEDECPAQSSYSKKATRLVVIIFLVSGLILLAWLGRTHDDPEAMPKVIFHTCMTVIVLNVLPATIILKNESLSNFAKKAVLIV